MTVFREHNFSTNIVTEFGDRFRVARVEGEVVTAVSIFDHQNYLKGWVVLNSKDRREIIKALREVGRAIGCIDD